MDRLRRKWDTAASLVPAPITDIVDTARLGIISIGSCDDAVREARTELADQKVATSYMRIRAFPFSDDVEAFIERHERVYVVEQNRDAQLRSLLLTETEADRSKLVPLLHYNGLPIASSVIVESVMADIAKGRAA